MDTTVKCSKCFSHVDGFYTDGAGRRVCKDCATPPVPAELAALRTVADAARAVVDAWRSTGEITWVPGVELAATIRALDTLDELENGTTARTAPTD